jgi:hypothetical protein
MLHEYTVGVTRAFLTNKKVSGGAVSLRRCQRNDCFANHLLDQRRRGYDRTGLVSLCALLKVYQAALLTSSFDCVVETRCCRKAFDTTSRKCVQSLKDSLAEKLAVSQLVKKFVHILWKPKVICRVYSSPPVVSLLRRPFQWNRL